MFRVLLCFRIICCSWPRCLVKPEAEGREREMHICVYRNIGIYIYIYIERERERVRCDPPLLGRQEHAALVESTRDIDLCSTSAAETC